MRPPELKTPIRAEKIHRALPALGAAALVSGLPLAPDRVWSNLLLVSFYVLTLGLGSTFFIALHYVTGASWPVAFRRVPEALTSLVWVGGVGIAAVFIIRPSLYPWMDPGSSPLHLSGFKALWLERSFFLVRAAVYVTAWTLLARRLVRHSQQQDIDGQATHSRANARLSALFIVVFAVTFSAASFDWIMSLEPEWYSTIFGIYNFSGLFLSSLALIALMAIWLHRLGPYRAVLTEEHLHDLGKLLFAFSTFWMYIWFSQYMLIWYADIPEETSHFIARQHGAWAPLFVSNLFLNWIVPFFALLPRRAKRDMGLLAKVAVVILVGRWLDLYLMIFPPVVGVTPAFGIWELALAAGGAGTVVLVFVRRLGRASVVPENDPLLLESLYYEQ